MKIITIFVNGSPLAFPFNESVEKNLLEWIEVAMYFPDRHHTWVGNMPDGQGMRIVLKGSRVDGYYIRPCPPPQACAADLLKEFIESQKADEDWKET